MKSIPMGTSTNTSLVVVTRFQLGARFEVHLTDAVLMRVRLCRHFALASHNPSQTCTATSGESLATRVPRGLPVGPIQEPLGCYRRRIRCSWARAALDMDGGQ